MEKWNKDIVLRLEGKDGKIIHLEEPAIFYDEMLCSYGPGTITQIYDKLPKWAKKLFDLEEALKTYNVLIEVGVVEKTGQVYKTLYNAWKLVDGGLKAKREIIKPVVTVDSKVRETFYCPSETLPKEFA